MGSEMCIRDSSIPEDRKEVENLEQLEEMADDQNRERVVGQDEIVQDSISPKNYE